MMVTTGGRVIRSSSASSTSSFSRASSAVSASFISSSTPNSWATRVAVSKSRSLLMVAMMPSIISFLMISPAGLPMRSDRSRTVMVSAVM